MAFNETPPIEGNVMLIQAIMFAFAAAPVGILYAHNNLSQRFAKRKAPVRNI